MSGQVAPETSDKLEALSRRRQVFVTDLVREAIDQFVEREAI